jgi:hypothetical protein
VIKDKFHTQDPEILAATVQNLVALSFLASKIVCTSDTVRVKVSVCVWVNQG